MEEAATSAPGSIEGGELIARAGELLRRSARATTEPEAVSRIELEQVISLAETRIEELEAKLLGDDDHGEGIASDRPIAPASRSDWLELVELQDVRADLLNERMARRARVFGSISEALSRLRRLTTVEEMIQQAAEEAAHAADFDRVVIYRVSGSEMLSEAFFIRGDPDASGRLLDYSRKNPAALQEQTLEREMVRRRRPMVVHDALNNPQTYKSLVVPYGTHSYVAAPIMPEGRVIGFVHADNGLRRPEDPAAVDEFDRDALFAFAEGFGAVVERAQLLARLRSQGEELRGLIGKVEGVLADQLAAQVDLASESAGVETKAVAALFGSEPEGALDAVLSRREREVLELVAAGASNAEVGERLVITEATVKSHMKRILRKLGAANRVEAASLWLRARGE